MTIERKSSTKRKNLIFPMISVILFLIHLELMHAMISGKIAFFCLLLHFGELLLHSAKLYSAGIGVTLEQVQSYIMAHGFKI